MGITEPFDYDDNLDFVIITSRCDDKIGQFIFPKSILTEKRILSKDNTIGKRGIRVYPSWDIATNKQAEKTQNWQNKYFILIEKDTSINFCFIKNYFFSEL